MSKLDSIGFNKEEDVLICTGDLIDRGEQNVECLELMDEPWFFTVSGNHEDMALKAILEPSEQDDHWRLWMYNGGSWYIDFGGTDDLLYVRELIKKTVLLPHVLEIQHGDKKVVVCHADWPSKQYPYSSSNVNNEHVTFSDPNRSDIADFTQNIIWSRDRYYRWEAQWDDFDVIEGADAFVFGHTPVSRPTSFGNQHYIDTGAVFTGELTIKELDL
jgi:serine/threonine protein phosphatase 1